jgi:P2-related tail formation protein
MFRLLVDASLQGANPEKYQQVMRRIRWCKNVRSALETVDYVIIPSSDVVVYTRVAAVGWEMEITTEVIVNGLE